MSARGHWLTLMMFMATSIFAGGGFYWSVSSKMNEVVNELRSISSTLVVIQVNAAVGGAELQGVSRDVNDLRTRVNTLEQRRQ